MYVIEILWNAATLLAARRNVSKEPFFAYISNAFILQHGK
jgi:hypothetical protein